MSLIDQSFTSIPAWPFPRDFPLASCFAPRAEFSLQLHSRSNHRSSQFSQHISRSSHHHRLFILWSHFYTPAFATVREMFSGFQAHPCSRVSLSHYILCSIFWPCRAEMDLPAVVILRTRVPAQWHFSISLAAVAQFTFRLRSAQLCIASSRPVFLLILQATHCPVEWLSLFFSVRRLTATTTRSSLTSFSRRLTVLRDRHRHHHHSPGDSLSCEIISTQPPADSLLLVECWFHHELYLRDSSVLTSERRIISQASPVAATGTVRARHAASRSSAPPWFAACRDPLFAPTASSSKSCFA